MHFDALTYRQAVLKRLKEHINAYDELLRCASQNESQLATKACVIRELLEIIRLASDLTSDTGWQIGKVMDQIWDRDLRVARELQFQMPECALMESEIGAKLNDFIMECFKRK